MPVTAYDAMNDALELCADLGFEMAPGFSTHWAMGSDTLIALGHPEQVHEWVEVYLVKQKHFPRPPRTVPLDPRNEADWRAALGDYDRVSDWEQLFERELAERPWRDVVAAWWPRLVPGISAALTHGLIRTMHAVRSIDRTGTDPTPLHRRELATALAYWAARYVEQPGPAALMGPAHLPDIIAAIPRLPADQKIGLKDKGYFLHMPGIIGWGDAVSQLAEPTDVQSALSDLTAAFAQVHMAHPDQFPIPMVHAVTAPAAMRVMLDYVPEEHHRASFVAIWQASAALLTSFAPVRPEEITPEEDMPTLAPAELAERAVEHSDQHALKFTEACLREHLIRPDPRYLLASERLLTKIPPYYRRRERHPSQAG